MLLAALLVDGVHMLLLDESHRASVGVSFGGRSVSTSYDFVLSPGILVDQPPIQVETSPYVCEGAIGLARRQGSGGSFTARTLTQLGNSGEMTRPSLAD